MYVQFGIFKMMFHSKIDVVYVLGYICSKEDYGYIDRRKAEKLFKLK